MTSGSEGTGGESHHLAAGVFTAWLHDMQHALRGERDADVPCGDCTACCTASQFVHIAPDEKRTLSRIPEHLLFPAPRLPAGHVLLGYDQHGRCPMLIGDGCSIYDDRPRTCRTYDCRVFPATGLEVDDDKPLIAQRVRRWRFDHPDVADRTAHEAVQAAARVVRDSDDLFPDGMTPTSPNQYAAVAIEIHDVFLGHDPGTGRATVVAPGAQEVRVAVTRRRGSSDGRSPTDQR